jgi:polysaccharide pyruvyl transferase WcaK-like protein
MRTLISGYYGKDNTGDDCLQLVAAWGMRTIFRPEKMYVTTNKNPNFMPLRSIIPIYRHRQSIKGRHRMAEWTACIRSKTVVFGGGSIFHTMRDLKRKMELLRLSGKGPHFAIGVSLGPFISTASEKYCAEIMKRMAFIGLRDQNSVDIARSWSADINFKKTFDLGPLLPRSYHLTIKHLMPGSTMRSGIGIALRDVERFVGGDLQREAKRRAKIISTIRALPKSLIDEIVLIDFNGHPTLGDAAIHADIRKEIERDVKVTYISYIANPLAVLNIIGKLRLLVAMRMHAAVFGYMTGTPTIILSYHPKCNGWASQIELSEKYIFDSSELEVSQLKQVVMEVLDGKYCVPTLEFAEAERRALLNFTLLGAQNP